MTEFPKRPLRADRFLYVLVGTWTALILILAGAAGGHLYLATLAGAKARAMAYCEGSQAVLAWHASQRGGQIAPQDPQRLPVDDGAQSKVSPPDLSDLAEGSSGVRFRVTCLYTPCCGSKPDAWERVALEALAAGEPEFYEFVTRDGERRLRYMRPLILPEEGYRHIGLPCLGEDGEMVGASISLPMAPLLAQDRRTMVLMLGTFAVLWLAGWGGLVGVRRRLAERRSHSEELHYRSALEGIVARVSNAFLAAAPDEIDKVLEDALRTIGEFLDVDRCYATLLSEDRSHVERSYVWATPGLERHDDILKDAPVDAFPWAVKLFESGEVLHVPRLADLPPEAQAVKDLLEAQESLSIINVPLVSSTGLLGFFGLDMVREERTWEESVIDMLRVLGHTIGYAAERQRTSAKLRRSEEHFRQLFEAAPVSILLETLAGKVVNCNALACRVFGYSREELLSLHASDLIAGDARTIVEEVIAQQKATGGYSGRALNLRKGGESFPVEVATRIIELDDGPHALVILQDVTERTRAQEERRQLEAQVQHTQKLESLGVLAGGIAHDFNNLLTTVLGNVDLATSSLSRVSPANEYLFNIEGAARRAADLCRHMLAYSGKGSLEAQPIDLRGLVLEMANLLEVSISKRVVLRYNFSDNTPLIEADPTQLRQVVMNLITNASEAIGDANGVISIATGVTTCDRGHLATPCFNDELPEGRYTYIEVHDTGCGMDAETQAKVFDPFFTTKFAGRGLGMAATLGIVRGHKGAIRLHSELGQGTSFRILFPVFDGVVCPHVDEPKEGLEWCGSGTILLVDDEEMVRSVGKRLLERLGFDVFTAADGVEAVEIFRQHAAQVCCVLLDLTMPRMNGEEAFHALRRIRSGIPIVITSGYNEQDVVSRFAGKGLTGFIQKPYRTRELAHHLRRILEEQGAKEPQR